jgi:signal transduction histidine kinase
VLHFRSLRLRIAAAFLIGTLATTGLVAGATYYLIGRQLTRDRVAASMNQTFKTLKILKQQLQAAGLKGRTPEQLRRRVFGRGDIVIAAADPRNPSGSVAATSVSFPAQDVPANLRAAVNRGKVAYVFSKGGNRLIVGTQIPVEGCTPPGCDPGEAYFAYSMQKVSRTLSLLLKIFIAVIGAAALAAGAVGLRLAGATIRPLRLAADAARQVADGNLDTRIAVSGEDELGRLATAFNEMTVALQARIDRERRFVADVSHELRTPLTSLKTSIDFLATRSGDLPEKFRGPMGLAAEEVRSLQRLVDDLLELSRVEAGGLVAEREEVDLVNFANEVKRRRAPGADVEIAGPERLVVWTDKMRLERIVGNLLENAIFHGGGEGVQIHLERADGHAYIAVTDHGPGIDPEKVPMIFERFWRGDTSRQRDGKIGAGLGLSIARENALIIGADINVQSIPGNGTRFEVRLSSEVAG